jgi:hypothetical protein
MQTLERVIRGILNEAEYGEEYGKSGQGVIAVKGNGRSVGVEGHKVEGEISWDSGRRMSKDGKIKLPSQARAIFLFVLNFKHHEVG